MAFSAHNEMGQNERVDTVCCTAPKYRGVNFEISKFIPNPSAQPFVPKWISSPSEYFHNYLPENVSGEITGQVTPKNRTDAPDVEKSLDTMNGVSSPISPPAPLSKHIALHLLSKVLDDETIFSLEEGNSAGETILPLTVDPNISDVSSPWLSPSPYPSPDCGIDADSQLSSSIPGEHIWHNSDVNHNTAMTTSISAPGSVSRGWSTQSPISPHGTYLARGGETGTTALLNGYDNLPSPQMSSSVESLGNGSQYYGSQYCSPALPDEWGHQSDSETSHCGDVNEHGLFDYSRTSPVHAPVGLICLSGSWPQKGPTCKPEYSASAKAEVDGQLKNGYCNSWKGGEFVEFQGGARQYRRSISSKSDDDSWIGRGKESLASPSHARQIPSNELHVRVDVCYEQLRYLEKERHKAELDICKFWPARRISSGGSISGGRLHHSPSRIDKLLVDVQKEHGKVEALVGRIERIRHSPLNINISESVDEMMASIRRLQSCRKEEINCFGGRNKHGMSPRSPDARDTVSLVSAVRELTLRTRCCRTAVWCASQLVLAEMTKQATATTPKLRSPSSTSESGGVDSSPSIPGGGGVS